MNTPTPSRFLAPVAGCILSLALLALGTPSIRAGAAPAGPMVPLTGITMPTTPLPVPAAVAIARPTPDEVKQAEEGLKAMLAQSAPAGMKTLVAKYPDLIAVRPPRANPALIPNLNNSAYFRTNHAAFVDLAKKGDIDVLFMGDSITDFWRRPATETVLTGGKPVFDKYFGNLKVANFGISGDTIQGVLYRLLDGEGQGFQPKAIMLMIGTNNANALSTAEIAEGIGAVVMQMRKDFPAAKILLLGIFPRGDPGTVIRKTVAEVNPIIAKLHDGKNVFYLDIGARFLDAAGNIPADIMPDKLHPTEKGYEIWAQAVKDPLAELMK